MKSLQRLLALFVIFSLLVMPIPTEAGAVAAPVDVLLQAEDYSITPPNVPGCANFGPILPITIPLSSSFAPGLYRLTSFDCGMMAAYDVLVNDEVRGTVYRCTTYSYLRN